MGRVTNDRAAATPIPRFLPEAGLHKMRHVAIAHIAQGLIDLLNMLFVDHTALLTEAVHECFPLKKLYHVLVPPFGMPAFHFLMYHLSYSLFSDFISGSGSPVR